MPKAKKKPAPEGTGPSGVQWAPISTVQRTAMMPQPSPSASSTSAFPSPSSEGPPPGPGGLRVQQPPVLPSNGPTGPHHHHYIPTPSSSGRGTPTGVRPIPLISNYGGPVPRHSRSPFPDHPVGGPSSHVLPSVESPQMSAGGRTPGGDQGPRPPHGVQPFGYRYGQAQPQPPPNAPPHPHPASAPQSPSQDQPPPPPPTEPSEPRPLTEEEFRRTQRFMSLNWRVGVINNPPFARPNNPPEDDGLPGQGSTPQIAGFVGQSQVSKTSGQGAQSQRPR